MNLPERPHRQQLMGGAGVIIVGASLILLHLGPVANVFGLVLIIFAVVDILKSMGWMFTRRF